MCSGVSAKTDSTSLRVNGMASRTSSGSLSDAKLVPLPANAFPTWLAAILLSEQPVELARSTIATARGIRVSIEWVRCLVT